MTPNWKKVEVFFFLIEILEVNQKVTKPVTIWVHYSWEVAERRKKLHGFTSQIEVLYAAVISPALPLGFGAIFSYFHAHVDLLEICLVPVFSICKHSVQKIGGVKRKMAWMRILEKFPDVEHLRQRKSGKCICAMSYRLDTFYHFEEYSRAYEME